MKVEVRKLGCYSMVFDIAKGEMSGEGLAAPGKEILREPCRDRKKRAGQLVLRC